MLPSCSETDLTMKFLLCGALLALSVWSHAEGAKVLGFTMDAPAPPGAELEAEGGSFAAHKMQHRLCAHLGAQSDDLGVFNVVCRAAHGVDWEALLRVKYGDPAVEKSPLKAWSAEGFAMILVMPSIKTVSWWAPRTAPKLAEHSGVADFSATLGKVMEKLQEASAAFDAAEHADVIAEEDF